MFKLVFNSQNHNHKSQTLLNKTLKSLNHSLNNKIMKTKIMENLLQIMKIISSSFH